jgi:uncharacterized protein YeaO (DUF488 family)
MIKQASVHQLRSGELTRKDGYIVVTMCFYPRGLSKDLRDEYHGSLAPDRVLFKDWQKYEKLEGHDAAFEKSHYEERFELDAKAFYHLRNLAERARNQDVYFVCQCAVGERCHREILLLTAEREYGAKIDKVYHSYPRFLKRLPALVEKAKLGFTPAKEHP